jgi:hypothetical protein
MGFDRKYAPIGTGPRLRAGGFSTQPASHFFKKLVQEARSRSSSAPPRLLSGRPDGIGLTINNAQQTARFAHQREVHASGLVPLIRRARSCSRATAFFGSALTLARCLSAFAKRPSAFAIISRSGNADFCLTFRVLRLGMPNHMAYATPRTAKTRRYPSPAGLPVWFAGLSGGRQRRLFFRKLKCCGIAAFRGLLHFRWLAARQSC